MTEYLDGLEPDATMSVVLGDIHSDAQALVEQADALRVAAHGAGSDLTTIPDIDLQMDWKSSRGHQGETLSTARLFTDTDLGRRALLSVWSSDEHTIKYKGVQAHRRSEISGDYALAVSGTGLIECLLKIDLLTDSPADKAEPFGRDLLPPWRLVADLPDDKKERLGVITSSLRGNMAAVELLMEGAEPEEALAAVGRVPA